MSRRTKIIIGIAAALVVVTLAAFWAVNRTLYGIPSFVVWRAMTSTFHGGQRAGINGISLYYETYGEGRPVLIVHGAGGSLETMHPFIRDLARDHKVIATDSRTQGRSSDGDGDLTYSKMGADMIALLDRLHIKQVDVIGWSDGGIVGLDMAMKHPERVRRLVAIGANVTPDGVPQSALSPDELAQIEQVEKPLYELLAPDAAHFPVAFAKILKMLRTEPHYTPADLSQIKSPTLIVAGEHDMILRAHTDMIADAIPHAKEIIVPNAEHDGPLTMPDLYAKMAREFIDAR
jgi:pimeloyl-ACP methyl ester carboxylesterase